MQEICNQIKQREEERQFEDELKELEKLQLQQKQEQMNVEDFLVKAIERDTSHLIVFLSFCLTWKPPCWLFSGHGKEKGGATASAGGDHAYQCWDSEGQSNKETGGEAREYESYGVHPKENGLLNSISINVFLNCLKINPIGFQFNVNVCFISVHMLMSFVGTGGKVWRRAETNEEGKGVGDR